jgi:hypothetical protein
VAVGIRARDRVEANVAVAAGAVLHQETLAQRLAQARADHARGDVGHAAGGHVDDHAYRLGGPGLCETGATEKKYKYCEPFHPLPPPATAP